MQSFTMTGSLPLRQWWLHAVAVAVVFVICHTGYSLGADSCTLSCGSDQKCQVVNNTESCVCVQQGYEPDPTDNTKCVDVDECNSTLYASPCQQVCINTPGSFRCSCNAGFQRLARNHSACADIDECYIQPCQHKCTNTDGGYTCSCNLGYILKSDNRSCAPDFNLDPRSILCKALNCQQNCTVEKSNATCFCNDGYVVDPQVTNKCIDIDECYPQPGPCEHKCTNTDGGYTCSCKQDYILKSDNRSCAPDFNLDPMCKAEHCQQNCTVENSNGKCFCNDGYEVYPLANNTCIDKDECNPQPGPCEHKCTNTDGGYTCSCNQGYILKSDKRTCASDFNLDPLCNAENCEQNCTVENGNGKCFCNDGYEVDPQATNKCIDSDECSDPTLNNCRSSFAEDCVNFDGGYNCTSKITFVVNATEMLYTKMVPKWTTFSTTAGLRGNPGTREKQNTDDGDDTAIIIGTLIAVIVVLAVTLITVIILWRRKMKAPSTAATTIRAKKSDTSIYLNEMDVNPDSNSRPKQTGSVNLKTPYMNVCADTDEELKKIRTVSPDTNDTSISQDSNQDIGFNANANSIYTEIDTDPASNNVSGHFVNQNGYVNSRSNAISQSSMAGPGSAYYNYL